MFMSIEFPNYFKVKFSSFVDHIQLPVARNWRETEETLEKFKTEGCNHSKGAHFVLVGTFADKVCCVRTGARLEHNSIQFRECCLEANNPRAKKQETCLEKRYSDHGIDASEQQQHHEGVGTRQDRGCHCARITTS